MKRMAWVLGWAVPECYFSELVHAQFPGIEHVIFEAQENVCDRLEKFGPFDWIAGYSLGSLLLLKNVERAQRLGRVALLAPIFAFTQEKNKGGQVPLAQLRQLRRWLKNDPRAALADFYQRAGLALSAEHPSTTDLTKLLWGLERLELDEVSPTLPPSWCAWCGEADPLLNAVRLHGMAPGIIVVPGAGHGPPALLRVLAEVVS